jgi:DNA-binding protein H-NS
VEIRMVDIDGLDIEELAKLRDDVTAKLAEKVAKRQQELQEELERVGALSRPGKAAAPARAAYRHPNKPELVWSGRGSQAKWVTDYLAGGGRLEDLKVA